MKLFCSGSIALMTCMIVLAAMISIATFTFTSKPTSWWSTIRFPHVCGSDPLIETMVFTEHHQYMSLSHDADVYWKNLTGPNGGFIRQPDREGIVRRHGVSMFHQLHCLQMIRAEIQRLMHLEQRHEAQRGGDGEQIGETMSDEAHWTHCLDYIRQVSGLSLLSFGPGCKDSLSDVQESGHPVRCRRYSRESSEESQWEKNRQW